MTLVFQKEPKATHFAATLLHPLKRAEDFYRFHKQTTSELRPVQPIISDKSDPAPCVVPPVSGIILSFLRLISLNFRRG